MKNQATSGKYRAKQAAVSMIAVATRRASAHPIKAAKTDLFVLAGQGGFRGGRGDARSDAYFRFDLPPVFLPTAFLATFADFLADFRVGLTAFFLVDEPLPPEKMLSQLSEYCFVAPTRTTLITQLFSEFENLFTTDITDGHG
jgi:hypothetical protein